MVLRFSRPQGIQKCKFHGSTLYSFKLLSCEYQYNNSVSQVHCLYTLASSSVCVLHSYGSFYFEFLLTKKGEK